MRILSFGGGVQTTALSILVAQGKVNVDAVVFADTGCEKPETYWYMDTYIKPLYQKLGIPFHSIKATANWTKEGLYQYCLSKSIIPDVKHKWCSKGFKALPISRQFPECTQLIGFSVDEAYRSDKLAHIEGESCWSGYCSH
uniref:Putative phosphoadenosine phosphosulfate n=1 Tax=viral metagenome TaxID=1070528 RepID=A0A6M3L8R3_9ZZZZ